MSLFSRRLALISITALAGCGFAPAYGPDGAAEGLRGAFEIDDPKDPEGFALVRRLEERLGLPRSAQYTLSASIRIGDDGLGITPDQTITRYNVTGEVAFTVRSLVSGDPLTSGRISTFTSYSATGTTVSTRAAQRDAEDRLMVALADQIVTRLIATSGDWRE